MSIKVAGADGTTHLGTLISGLQWAVDHQGRYGIKVLNISLGFKPSESTVINPLDMAVQAVWNAGITVVASAGNAGPFNGTILSPGDDPLVITAGALDDMATPSPADDEMTDFSSVGPTSPDGWVKPDLVTSGRSVVSLAAPGSTVYNSNPSARLGAANFVGSGTSFSAAITSGAAALVLADNPGLPQPVKARLLGTADAGPIGNPFADGHGALDAYAAATSGPMNFSQSAARPPTGPAARSAVAHPARRHLEREPVVGNPRRRHHAGPGTAPGGTAPTGTAWPGTTRAGTAQHGGAAWNGANWVGWAWNDSAWNGSAWDGSAWVGLAWNSSAWN